MDVLEQILETFWPGITKSAPVDPPKVYPPAVIKTIDLRGIREPISKSELVNADILGKGMPLLHKDKVDVWVPFLQHTFYEFEIKNPLRAAAFLAQAAHESSQFRILHEIWGPTTDQKEYEPPNAKAIRLGNDQPGDGFKFRGRGICQLTGKENYREYGELLNVDLVADPDKAAEPELASRIFGLFWQKKHLNPLADARNFREITRRINGGFNGLEDRIKFYHAFLTLLGQDVV